MLAMIPPPDALSFFVGFVVGIVVGWAVTHINDPPFDEGDTDE